MPGHNPMASVLITTYNRSRLLRRIINCVLSQDFTDCELVIIDGGSPREVVASFRTVLPVLAFNGIVPTWNETSYLVAAELSPAAIDWSRPARSSLARGA